MCKYFNKVGYSKHKGASQAYIGKGIPSNEEQVELYESKDSENALKFLNKFFNDACDSEHQHKFAFCGELQKRIINDMVRGKNLKWLRKVIPMMAFTGESLVRFIKSSPVELLRLYCLNHIIPSKCQNLTCNRKRGIQRLREAA